MRRFVQVLLVAMSSWLPAPCLAELVGYRFTGSIAPLSTQWPTFGHVFPVSTPIVGRFVYDTQSVATHSYSNCTDCAGYRQEIINGFFTKIGDVSFRADDYVVDVINDMLQPPSTGVGEVDSFGLTYHSNLNPALTKPLIVDGVDWWSSAFFVSFYSDGEPFVNHQLPPSLNSSDYVFPSEFNLLDDLTGSAAAVVFRVESLQPFYPGDYNLDGEVDGADQLIWQNTLGSTRALNADGNFDGIIDAADYTVWRDHLGPGASAAASGGWNSVPEPLDGRVALVGMGIAVLATRVRQLA